VQRKEDDQARERKIIKKPRHECTKMAKRKAKDHKFDQRKIENAYAKSDKTFGDSKEEL
jgi:hypothetical protein